MHPCPATPSARDAFRHCGVLLYYAHRTRAGFCVNEQPQPIILAAAIDFAVLRVRTVRRDQSICKGRRHPTPPGTTGNVSVSPPRGSGAG